MIYLLVRRRILVISLCVSRDEEGWKSLALSILTILRYLIFDLASNRKRRTNTRLQFQLLILLKWRRSKYSLVCSKPTKMFLLLNSVVYRSGEWSERFTYMFRILEFTEILLTKVLFVSRNEWLLVVTRARYNAFYYEDLLDFELISTNIDTCVGVYL